MEMLRCGEHEARPLVQGGMGVGVSAHCLAAAVAREDCVGTISSVDLRRLHPDLMHATGRSRAAGIDSETDCARARVALPGGGGAGASSRKRDARPPV